MSRRDAYDALEERVDETFEALVADLDYDLTPSQEKNARRLLAEGLTRLGIEYADQYEIKEARLSPLSHGGLELFVVVGRLEDEGTLAEVVARYRGQFFLSRRGGVAFYRRKKRGKGSVRVQGLRKARIYGFGS